MTRKKELELKAMLTLAHLDYKKGLNARAFFKTNDRQLGEDLVQNTFIKTWTYLVKGGKIDLMKAFLYHILNNLIIDEYRKKKNVSLDFLITKGFEPGVNELDHTLNFLDGKKALLMIHHLPEKYQKVMRMHYVEDLTLEEMSKATGESKNTLAVQTHRGIEKLKIIYNAQIKNP